MKKIAILGCTSFLAQKYLAFFAPYSDYEFVLFGSKPTHETHSFYNYSLPDYPLDLAVLASCDFVFYFSAAGVQANVTTANSLLYSVNVYEPIAISQYLETIDFKGQFITFGSYFEMGYTTAQHYASVKELIHADGQVPNHYCNSKRLLTRYIHGNIHRINWLHFILPTIYGPGENKARLVPYLVDAIQNATPIQVTSGSQIRQYLHVDDVVHLLAKITQSTSNPNGIFNVSTKEAFSIKHIIDTVFETLHFVPNAAVSLIQREDTMMSFLAIDATETSRVFNWNATLSLQDGIKTYITDVTK